MTSKPVVVIGGGLAGITASVDLADRGHEVVLLESRSRLGGAAGSFERGGVRADTGQHVLLRCYTEYRGLIERMGASSLVSIQDSMDIPVIIEGRPIARLHRGQFGPAPMHLIPAVARYGALTPRERASAIRAARAIRSIDPDDCMTDERTFGEWLRSHGQNDRVIRRLWGLLCVAALNLTPDAASLALAAKVIQTGLLAEVSGGDIGLIQAPLSQVHDDAAARLLAHLGVTVRRGSRVTAVDQSDNGFVVRTRSDEVAARGAVLAIPHQYAARIVPPSAIADPDSWGGLGASPIINTHLRFDRTVTHLPFAAAPESPVQWLFDRTSALGIKTGQYLVTSTSAADSLSSATAQQICTSQYDALAVLLPGVRQAKVLDTFVTREPRATFRQAAGTARLRPQAQTALPGLVLAGAWTATGWPDTMEGAVRSGHVAAEVLCRSASGSLPTNDPTGSSRREAIA
ncbi:squalene-associated FAD-dependent desaturase [Antricoccus suffuscus]|uniref:Squalene-associated FAD-dependent desaturase n=1 Tax=Antricoccus suffuscus TaxID=1629062 RepID=A0A2T0ZXJ6_9ACTN|nr:hydroxysqualene dehydroxylase HpnE [Antricoccus suffuscus]PRZ41085.1 squalene-associated FAD-dependent desaturase [Antricoccus suffuscus]